MKIDYEKIGPNTTTKDLYRPSTVRTPHPGEGFWIETGILFETVRSTLNLSRDETARSIGVSLSTVYRFENGVPIHRAYLIEKAFGLFLKSYLLEAKLKPLESGGNIQPRVKQTIQHLRRIAKRFEAECAEVGKDIDRYEEAGHGIPLELPFQEGLLTDMVERCHTLIGILEIAVRDPQDD